MRSKGLLNAALWLGGILSSALLPRDGSAAPLYPLSVSPDGAEILDASDRPVFFNGAAPWHILARLTREEAITYLDDRQARGVDALLVSLLVSDGYSIPATSNAYGDQPFRTPGDFTQPNEAYFSHVDWFLDQTLQRGMTVFLFPVYLGFECGSEGWCSEVQNQTVATMRGYGRWLGSRYRDQPNLVWVHGGDVAAADYGVLDRVDAVAEGIREFDGVHLHTAHSARFRAASDDYDRPWLDFDTVYSACAASTGDLTRVTGLQPPRPMIYIEGYYEGEYDATETCIRSQAYWSLLFGSSGHFYGNGGVWDFLPGWPTALDSEGAMAIQHFGVLVRSREGARWVHDPGSGLVVNGRGDLGSADYVAVATSSDRRSAFLYLPSPRPLTLDLTRLAPADVEIWWVDPVTGVGSFGGVYSTVSTTTLTPPTTGDVLLVIDDTAAPLVDPWNPTTSAPLPGPRLRLERPRPNPFNPVTTVRFTAPNGVAVQLAVFDARGRRVAELFRGEATGSIQEVRWTANSLPSGLYLFRLSADGRDTVVRKALLVE